ncbi:MAG TPA: alpha/beta fold hydrolase [Pyrinomonadaceae bacterium]
MSRIKTNGVETVFEDEGNGPAIVFLHGFPFDRTMWRDQVEVLRGTYRVIAPDLRGLGETRSAAEVATMDQMARDVAALLDQLEIDRAVVCGLSMGGYVAFDFQHSFPDRVRALVLAGTRAPADSEQEKQNRERQAARMLAEGMKGIAEETLPKLLAPETLARQPEVVKRVREMIESSDAHGAAAAQRGMAVRRDYSDDLAQINVPALIIVGREDSIRPVSDAEFMHRQLRDSRLEIIDKAAHLSNLEQPEVFNRALGAFLQASGCAA